MRITQEETVTAITSVLTPGDDVLIHAALGGLGYFEAGLDSVISTLCDAVGADGTIIMMTDSRSFARTGRFSLDQPSETGLLTERFRLTNGVVRSCVPMVSFCAMGARAEDYTEEYHSHLDNTATITRLLDNDGKIMLLGVGYEKCTLYHLSEERHDTPYNFYKEFSGVLIEDEKELRPISQRYFVRRDMSVKKSPSIAGRMLEEGGGLNVVPLGAGFVRVFKARDFDACCMKALEADPDAFLSKTS